MEPGQEADVREALVAIQDEFLPVKENIVTLLEHLEKRGEKRGRVETLVRLLSAAFPEFLSSDADRVRGLPDQALDELTDAIAVRRPWAEIEALLRRDA
jgi:hypothetical protein